MAGEPLPEGQFIHGDFDFQGYLLKGIRTSADNPPPPVDS